MRRLATILCFALCLPAGAAAAEGGWTYSADLGMSFSNRSEWWPSWRGAIHRRVASPHHLGISFGQIRWAPRSHGSAVATDDFYDVFRLGSLGPYGDLYHVSLSWLAGRPDAVARGSTSFVRTEVGGYAQWSGARLDGPPRPGFSLAFGWTRTRGLSPNTAVRWDVVFTDPGPTMCVTGEFGASLFR